MSDFFDQPILNSPYTEPNRHWELLEDGQPTHNIIEQRRPSSYLSPIPRPKNQSAGDSVQLSLGLDEMNFHGDSDTYNVSEMINAIRSHVRRWRSLPQESWKVFPETARLLNYWRTHKFSDIRPFFCQVEAVETLIWLTEVAPETTEGKRLLERIDLSSQYANPGLLRFALKMATGAGKTTVMAMIIAWQTINAIRHPSSNRFTRGFLVVTPGLTVRDRLRVLQPNDPDSYYQKRELVPPEMLSEVKQARIVITNYHAFMLRERLNLSTGTKNLLMGRTDCQPLQTTETTGQALQRIMPELMGMKRLMVLNDEAHHCYGQKPENLDVDEEEPVKNKDEDESEKNNEAARVWISGLKSVAERFDLIRVVDLSATPFFLQGSGYAEGTLFPWTVSDFSLMDAIECGIVKLPRVPVAENIASSSEMPQFRNIWETIRKDMPKISRAKAGDLDPMRLPLKLLTALDVLYAHYLQTFNLWAEARSPVPPCFIIVCQNTAISELVYKYVSGYYLPPDENNNRPFMNGHFPLFQNFTEDGKPLDKPNTILIDSQQLDSGVEISKEFKAAAQEEIERFKREIVERTGDVARAQNITDEDILREVMNTVGKPGTLGESVRCVVSVSMLTEGWDANTVTHICGIRAFGTQLLCEQVIGRALRRQSYEINDHGLFNVEYADIFGIPFDFAGKPKIAPPQPPADTVTVKALPERANCEIRFPRVDGYRTPLPSVDISAQFSEDSVLTLTPEITGPTITQNAGIIGQEINLTLKGIESVRPSSIEFHITRHLLEYYLREPGKEVPISLYGSAKKIVHQWFENYLICQGGTIPGMLVYRTLADMACERIVKAIVRASKDQSIHAILSPYNPSGTTTGVHFITSKKHRWVTNPNKCHLNYAICDSNWEIQFCQQLERDDRVLAYVRNHGIGFEVPYVYAGERKTYLPDFIVLMDDGHGKEDQLHVVVEIKGLQADDDLVKRDTMLTQWVPGVNNLGSFGRWDFKQVNELYQMMNWHDNTNDESHLVF